MSINKNDSDIIVKQVTNKAEREQFLRLPFAIYGPQDHWVPPLLQERRDFINPKKNSYFDHAETALFVAYKKGEPVGRISAQICALYQARYQNATGQFGFLEAIDDLAVFKALLTQAQEWLKARGMKHIQGPFSFSINEEMGLLIDGFDTPPMIMMGHAKPYYAERLEALGYSKAADAVAFDYKLDTEVPKNVLAIMKRAKTKGDFNVRSFRKSHFDEDLAIILDIFNDAWSDNWGYVPMTDREIEELGKILKLLVKDEYIVIAEYNGRPVAMGVTMPNINEAIADLNGRLLPFGWLKLLWRLKVKTTKTIRLPLMGVRREYHGTSLGAAFALAIIDAERIFHKALGTYRAELSWVLEGNVAMRRMIEHVGGKAYKTYRVYQREL